jgi:hypothetical protein
MLARARLRHCHRASIAQLSHFSSNRHASSANKRKGWAPSYATRTHRDPHWPPGQRPGERFTGTMAIDQRANQGTPAQGHSKAINSPSMHANCHALCYLWRPATARISRLQLGNQTRPLATHERAQTTPPINHPVSRVLPGQKRDTACPSVAIPLGRIKKTNVPPLVIGVRLHFVMVEKQITNCPTEPIRWSLKAICREFQVNRVTMQRRMTEAKVIAGIDGLYSTHDVLIALTGGDYLAERLRKLKAEAENAASLALCMYRAQTVSVLLV